MYILKFCNKCGNQLSDEAKFCNKCGNILNNNNTRNISNKSETRNPSTLTNIAFAAMLFVPILSQILRYIVAGLLNIDASSLFGLGFILNAIFIAIDLLILKKEGYHPSKSMTYALIIIPVYIYKRMKLVNGKKILCTCIWTIVYVFSIFIPGTFWVKAVGMSNPQMIKMVQNGHLLSDPKETILDKIGEMDNYAEWTTKIDSDRRVLVTAKGDYEGQDFNYTWELKTNGKIVVRSALIDNEPVK